MRNVILFGTESGTAELVANDLADALADGDLNLGEVEVFDLGDYPVQDLDAEVFYIVVCSTYGEGDLPASARPFHGALEESNPDLSGMRYAMFGMGDSSYEDSYSQGSEIIDRSFTELGGQRVGEYGRHDANGREAASDVALEWLQTLGSSVMAGSDT